MKLRWIILLLFITHHVVAQTIPVRFVVEEDQSNTALYGVKVSIPGITPAEFFITQSVNTFQLDADEVTALENKLANIRFSKKNFKDEVMAEFTVSSNPDENIIRAHMISNAVLQLKNAYYVRGTVKSADGELQANVAVRLAEKDYATTTDQYGYYSLKIPVDKVKDFNSLSIIFTGGKKNKQTSIPLKIDKKTFDYRLDVLFEKRDTRDFISGELVSKKGVPANLSLTLSSNGITYLDTTSDEQGNFGFVIDTVNIPPDTKLHLAVSGTGWEDTSVVFQPNMLKGLLVIHVQPMLSFPRSRHEADISFRAFPGIDDYEVTAGYTYHLSTWDRRLAVRGYAGYRQFQSDFPFNVFKNTGPDSAEHPYATDSIHRQFSTVIIGAGALIYFKPFDRNTRWNPVAEVHFSLGPKKDFTLIETGISAGTLYNISSLLGVTLKAQLSYSYYHYKQPEFNTFSDASFHDASAHALHPFLFLSFQFFPSR